MLVTKDQVITLYHEFESDTLFDKDEIATKIVDHIIVGLQASADFLTLHEQPKSFSPRQVEMINSWYSDLVAC